MTVYAWDAFASSATAAARLDSRVSMSGHAWRAPAAGWYQANKGASYIDVGYFDSAADGKCKIARAVSNGSMHLLPVAMQGSLWRAHMRRHQSAVAGSNGCGVGFCDDSGRGYFASWKELGSRHEIVRVDGSNTAVFPTPPTNATVLSFNAFPSIPGAANFSNRWTLDYTPASGLLRLFLNGVATAATATDTQYTPLYPAIWILGGGNQSILDCIFEGA